MNFLIIALKYFPYILQAIKITEDALSGQNIKGQDKKSVVMSTVKSAVELGEKIPEDHVKVISTMIDQIVTVLNAAGIFNSSKTASK